MGGTKDNIGNSIPAALPNITGQVPIPEGNDDLLKNNGGAFYLYAANKSYKNANNGGNADDIAGFDASNCSPIYSNDCTTVQPPAIKTIWCIQHTSTNTPAICMPKVNYKKVKIFRHKMVGENHAFTFDKIVDTISEPTLNEDLLNNAWNNSDANPTNIIKGETLFTADDNYFMEIMVRNMVDANRK